MTRRRRTVLTRQGREKAGRFPASPVSAADRTSRAAAISIIEYDEAKFTEAARAALDQCAPSRDAAMITWINVEGSRDAAVVEKLGECFGLHRLVTEDILSGDQRPKSEDFGTYLSVVLKMLLPGAGDGEIVSEQVSIILGRNFVLSFQEGVEGDVFGAIRERIRTGAGKIRKLGADYLAYALIDAVVDRYFVVLERFGEKIDRAEDELIADPTEATAQEIYRLKRELLVLHRSVWPVREVASALSRRETGIFSESTAPYLRDVYDHVVQAIDTVEIYRELLSEMIGIYLSGVSNRLNAIMKVLTIIATIFMPLTFIAGIYGMNFKVMPELQWPFGYPLVLLAMAGIGAAMLVAFKRKKWL